MHCAPETLLRRGRETCWADFQDQKMLHKRLCGCWLWVNQYCHVIFILQTKWKFLVEKRPNVLFFIYRPRQANLQISPSDSLLSKVCKLAYPCTYILGLLVYFFFFWLSNLRISGINIWNSQINPWSDQQPYYICTVFDI